MESDIPKTLWEISFLTLYRDLLKEQNLSKPVDQHLEARNAPPLVQKQILGLHADISKLNNDLQCLIPNIKFEDHLFLNNRMLDVPRIFQDLLDKNVVNHQVHSIMCLAIGNEEAFLNSNPWHLLFNNEIDICLKVYERCILQLHELVTEKQVPEIEEALFVNSIYQLVCMCMDNYWINGAILTLKLVHNERNAFANQPRLEDELVDTYVYYKRCQDRPDADTLMISNSKTYCSEFLKVFWSGNEDAFNTALQRHSRERRRDSHRIQVGKGPFKSEN